MSVPVINEPMQAKKKPLELSSRLNQLILKYSKRILKKIIEFIDRKTQKTMSAFSFILFLYLINNKIPIIYRHVNKLKEYNASEKI